MMFGNLDQYRDNTTPQQRLRRAIDRLRDAEFAVKQAKEDYERAAAEVVAYGQQRMNLGEQKS